MNYDFSKRNFHFFNIIPYSPGREKELADAIGELVELKIEGFDLLGEESLQGTIIRSSDNDGIFHVGCRMASDHEEIEAYVREKMGNTTL